MGRIDERRGEHRRAPHEASERQVGAYLVSTDRSGLDLGRVLDWLRSTAWAGSLTEERLRVAVEHSLCAGAYLGGENPEQVGFARLITDHATFGYLTDVYVAKEHRGRGLAREMSRALLGHKSVAAADHFALIAGGAARGVYEGIGFSTSGLALGSAEGRAGAGWMDFRKKG